MWKRRGSAINRGIISILTGKVKKGRSIRGKKKSICGEKITFDVYKGGKKAK